MLARFRPLFFLLMAQTCVGVNIVFSKGLVNHINPLVIMSIRFTLAGLFMTCLLFRSEEKVRWNFHLTFVDWLVLIAQGIGAGLFFNFLLLIGLHFTNANSAGLITSLLPAMVVCLSVFLFKQKLERSMVIAIMIAVCGLVLINFESFGGESKNAMVGNFLVFLALFPDALYYTLSKYYPLTKVPPITKAILLNILNLPLLYLILPFLPRATWTVITWHDGMIMALVGMTTGFFFICWQRGVAQVDAGYAALATAFMPLATVLLAWVVLHETLTPVKFIGMLLVILSIVHYARHQRSNG